MRGGLVGLTAGLAIVATSVLSGCAGSATPETDGLATAPDSSFSPSDPLFTPAPAAQAAAGELSPAAGLIGLWTVSGAAGEQDGTWVRFAAEQMSSDVTVFRSCGELFLDWAATATRIVVGGVGGSQACFTQPDGSMAAPDAPWLLAARGFSAEGTGWVLLDASGAAVAHLAPAGGALPNPPADISPSLIAPPVIDDHTRAQLRRAAPLPDGVTAATAADLVGTWRSTDWAAHTPAAAPGIPLPTGYPQQATITFGADGTLAVLDCHSAAARQVQPTPTTSAAVPWVGDGSDFATPGFASDSSLCAPTWSPSLSGIRTIAIDGGYLRLFDIAGVEQARLERVPA